MNISWQQFLESSDRTRPVTFPDSGQCVLNDLSHFGLIRVKGEDAESFLQGQTTNDIKQVKTGHSQFNSLCSPKGRILANFRVIAHAGGYLLVLPKERQEAIKKRLSMFVLMSKVTLENADEDLVITGLSGDCASAAEYPQETDQQLELDGLSLVRLGGDLPRLLVIGDSAAMQSWWRQHEADGVQGDVDFWALADIRAGIPHILEPTVEAFVPQMVNLEAINGVSFTKGCYTGQEVVARMRYLGKLKRRMYHVSFDSESVPAPGHPLHSAGSASAQGAGKVVDAKRNASGRIEALVVSEIDAMQRGDLSLEEGGEAMTLETLPYSWED